MPGVLEEHGEAKRSMLRKDFVDDGGWAVSLRERLSIKGITSF